MKATSKTRRTLALIDALAVEVERRDRDAEVRRIREADPAPHPDDPTRSDECWRSIPWRTHQAIVSDLVTRTALR